MLRARRKEIGGAKKGEMKIVRPVAVEFEESQSSRRSPDWASLNSHIETVDSTNANGQNSMVIGEREEPKLGVVKSTEEMGGDSTPLGDAPENVEMTHLEHTGSADSMQALIASRQGGISGSGVVGSASVSGSGSGNEELDGPPEEIAPGLGGNENEIEENDENEEPVPGDHKIEE